VWYKYKELLLSAYYYRLYMGYMIPAKTYGRCIKIKIQYFGKEMNDDRIAGFFD
jgi:hypothetical protein